MITLNALWYDGFNVGPNPLPETTARGLQGCLPQVGYVGDHHWFSRCSSFCSCRDHPPPLLQLWVNHNANPIVTNHMNTNLPHSYGTITIYSMTLAQYTLSSLSKSLPTIGDDLINIRDNTFEPTIQLYVTQ